MTFVYAAIACGLLAVVYGFVTSQQVLRASAGNEKMQDIAAAIQEGAKAYLGRQYTTIAIVGVVVAIILAVTLGLTSTLGRSEEHTSELQSLMRLTYAVFSLKQKQRTRRYKQSE